MKFPQRRSGSRPDNDFQTEKNRSCLLYTSWELTKFVRPATTFEELYFFINSLITARGFCNLDFMGNLGHSIETSKEARIYIERGNTALLSQAGLFTFEPHIGRKNSPYGYKREDIYYFSEGTLKRL